MTPTHPSTPHSEILIIGGGINGLLTAKQFIEAGHQVSILDQSQVGQESSWAGGGILLPLYPWRQDNAITQLVIRSLAIYPELSEDLRESTGIDPEWYACGLLISANPDIEKATNWCKNNNIEFETNCLNRFQDFNVQIENPLWLPQIAQARNPRLIRSLKNHLEKKGVSFFENQSIKELKIQNKKIEAVVTHQYTFQAEQFVLATGAWTDKFFDQFLADCNQQIKIKPMKGQMLLFDAEPDTLSHMILAGDRYLIPRRDGKILAGSTVEDMDFNKTPTEEAKQQLTQFALDLFPKLRQFNISHHWAGLRPGTKNGVPYVGLHPEINNLSINAGHFRNGLVMAPASAQLLADLVLNRKPCVNPEPYQIKP